MRLDDVAGEVEPHPDAPSAIRFRLAEEIEDVREEVAGDPRPVVHHPHHDLVRPRLDRRLDPAARRREADGVGQDVREDLPEPDRVAEDPDRLHRQPRRERERLPLEPGPDRLDALLEDATQVGPDAFDVQPAHPEVREGREVLADAHEQVELPGQDPGRRPAGVLRQVPVLDQVEGVQAGADRVPDLVADREHELSQAPVGLRELGVQVLHVRGQAVADRLIEVLVKTGQLGGRARTARRRRHVLDDHWSQDLVVANDRLEPPVAPPPVDSVRPGAGASPLAGRPRIHLERLARGAKEVAPLRWGRVSDRSQYALFLLAVAFTWLMGLMGYIRSSLRQHWHVTNVFRDASPDAFTPTRGYAANVGSVGALVFMGLVIFVFWVSRVSARHTDVPDYWKAEPAR